jgi:hypothetical protein
MAPEVYAAEAENRPKYAKLQAEEQAYLGDQALQQARKMYAEIPGIEAGYNAANRAAELQQLQATLPEYQKAFATLTPGYQEALGSAGQLAKQSMERSLQGPQLTAFEQGVGGPQVGGMVGGVRGPRMQSGLGQINQNTVQQYLNTMPGMQDYASLLAQQSQAELAAGRSLTPEEQRLADQSARSAFAARGTALGGRAVNAEILNRASVQNERYQQRLKNSAAAAGTIQAIYQPALAQSLDRQKAGLEYGLGAQRQAFDQAMQREQLGMGAQETAFNQALQRGQAEQQRLRAATDIQAGQAQLGAGALGQLQAAQAPVLQAFYKQPILQGATNSAQQMGYNMGQAAGPQLFNPESQTGMGSIYGAYNAQMNLAGAQAQANAAKSAGKSSMFGSLGGGLLSAGGSIGAAMILCWVAREIYGSENPKWLEFRKWLIANADDGLLDAYIEHGEEFAKFISDKPKLKQLIKGWMDSKIS